MSHIDSNCHLKRQIDWISALQEKLLHDDDYAHGEREFEAKRSHMSKKYHFIGQNQLK